MEQQQQGKVKLFLNTPSKQKQQEERV